MSLSRFVRTWTSGERIDTLRRSLIVLSAAVALLFVLGCGYVYDQLSTPCDGPGCGFLQRPRSPSISPEFYARWTVGRETVTFLVFTALAATLFIKAPRQPMALLGAITLTLFAGAVLPDATTALIVSDSPARYPGLLLGQLGGVLVVAFVLLFPDGRFVPGWTRWLLVPVVPLAAIGLLVPVDHPLGYQGDLALLIWLCLLAIGAGAQIVRYRRERNPIERQQLKWVGFGFATAAIALVVGALLLPLIPPSVIANRRKFALIGTTLTSAFLLVIPLSIALALLRYRLWDVDRIARRAVLSAALLATVTALYALIVLGASALAPGGANRLWPLVAAVAVALLLQPVRSRLERSVNRLFYGQRDDPYAVLSGLSQQLEGALTQETALPTIVDTIATELRLPYVAIALVQEGQMQIVAQQGEPAREQTIFPLVSGSETIGELRVSPPSEDDTFRATDSRLLTDIARQAGAVAEAVRLTNQLEQANRHLLSVRSEERQRLRRDLHDGLGPLLASQMLILDSARTLMPSDPTLAGNLLDQMHQHIQTAVDDVRRLVNSLRPAALDELGLTAALRAGTADLQRAGLHLTIDAPTELPPLSSTTETAAYRIGMEGVTNVVRHARATTCDVSLAVEPSRTLRLTIRDNGTGIPANASAGVGIASMRERALELGGSLMVESPPHGGTLVTARLPLDGNSA